jgi:hypothetical protein
MLPEEQQRITLLSYVLLKYGLGYSYTLLIPLGYLFFNVSISAMEVTPTFFLLSATCYTDSPTRFLCPFRMSPKRTTEICITTKNKHDAVLRTSYLSNKMISLANAFKVIFLPKII